MRVVRCVAVHVSSVTITLDLSIAWEGTVDSRMALNGGAGWVMAR